MTWRGACIGAAVGLWIGGYAAAQGVPLANPSFEEGNGGPAPWVLSGGEGAWRELEGAAGQRGVVVAGTGNDSNYWRSESLPFEPNTLYRVRFRARNLDSTGGTAVSGPPFANRDIGTPPAEWRTYTSFFVTPENLSSDQAWVRFGQWHAKGTMAFDDIEVLRAEAIHEARDGLTLGEGEVLRGLDYEFTAPFEVLASNYSRPLVSHRGAFNTNRWTLGAGSEVVYRHALDGRRQETASVEVGVSYRMGGRLVVEAGTDGTSWVALGMQEDVGPASFVIPDQLLPADAVWIRLRLEAEAAGDVMNVDRYVYLSSVDGPAADWRGSTRFLAVRSVDPRFRVTPKAIQADAPDTGLAFTATIENVSGASLKLPYRVTASVDGRATTSQGEADLPDGSSPFQASYALAGTGTGEVTIELGSDPGYRAEWTLPVSILYAAHYGQILPGSNDAVALWTASSGWKVSRTRPVPQAAGDAITISAARNEAEAAQLVVRPAAGLKGLTARANALSGPDGAVLPAENIDILRVGYVNVTRPTDSTSSPGLWPDPLPPLKEPLDAAGGINHPLWVRVRVPKDIPAGTYTGAITIEAEDYRVDAPLRVEVYDFTLPDRATCVSAFGFSPHTVFQYHGITDEAQKREVLDKYLQSFRDHRISPYNPAPLDPFRVTWPDTDNPEELVPQFDWTAFDTAMTRALDEYGFNSFNLPGVGLGSGTFHSRVEPELNGYKEGTPQYEAAFKNYWSALQEHLRERGWLDEAYVYWFDEPDPKDYEFVMNGFRKLKESAPDITRMLTEQVEPDLVGGPNLWCAISPEYDHEAAEARRAEGEKFWWYVCTYPKAPYATLFIDHPGTELRVWLWQTWQRRIDGILVWQSNYWTSPEAYPHEPQNPYEDPMSWQTSYGLPVGVRRPWGNGDGRFIYPPEAADGYPSEPVLEGPVDSIRWEMLRDGVEDYEYLARLRDLIERKGSTLAPEEKARYESLLDVPADITADMTKFTADPAPIMARRQAVARAVEALERLP